MRYFETQNITRLRKKAIIDFISQKELVFESLKYP